MNTHTSASAADAYPTPGLFINGQCLHGGGRATQDVVNPATGEVLGQVPLATRADLDAALAAAETGFTVWRNTQPVERARVLKQAVALLHERSETLARLLTLEVGKPLTESHFEIHMAASTLEWLAEEGRRSHGRVLPGSLPNGARFTVVKEPVGPVASFAPWNWPVDNACRKIGAALAAGCSIIHKPAEEAPASALAVAQCFVDAGLPPGVLGMVFGVPHEVSEHLIASPIIRKLSFTGSIPVGKQLMKLAAEGCKRTTMELGGHAPVLVFDDADVDAVLDLAMVSKFRNAGQVCVSPTRFYVQQGIYARFAEGFAERARAWRVGNGLDAATQMGPLAHARRREAVAALVQQARDVGARLLTGGSALPGPGYFYAPTVLADVPAHARIMNEEPFGPVALLNPFTDLDDGIAKANRLNVGLAAFGFSTSAKTVRQLGDRLQAGMVAINSFAVAMPGTPFGGIKESGHGAECGPEGLEACLVTKTISLA